MNSKNIQNKKSFKELFEALNGIDTFEVSMANVEIILERFCNSKEINFPFSQ